MVLRKAPSPRFPNTMQVMFSSLATLQMASPGVPSSILLLQGTYKLENVSRINKTLTEKIRVCIVNPFWHPVGLKCIIKTTNARYINHYFYSSASPLLSGPKFLILESDWLLNSACSGGPDFSYLDP